MKYTDEGIEVEVMVKRAVTRMESGFDNVINVTAIEVEGYSVYRRWVWRSKGGSSEAGRKIHPRRREVLSSRLFGLTTHVAPLPTFVSTYSHRRADNEVIPAMAPQND
ncbi:hypothetical protein Ancab_005575 [Ancistrocladus abbreviatus]